MFSRESEGHLSEKRAEVVKKKKVEKRLRDGKKRSKDDIRSEIRELGKKLSRVQKEV